MRAYPLGNKILRSLRANQDVLCYAKYVARTNAAGALVTAATIQVQANSLLFTVNGAAEVVIGTYTGNSGADNEIVYADANIANIQRLVETINGLGAGMVAAGTEFRRWRAGYGDFRPGYVIGAGDATAAGAANALLGETHIGYPILAANANHAVANTRSVCLGVETAQEGKTQLRPSHFETDYTSTVAGVITYQRFRQLARQEDQYGQSRCQVVLTGVAVGCLFANNDIVITAYDSDNQIVWSYPLGTGGVAIPTAHLSEENPVYGTWGSPMWIEVAGTGNYTDGAVTVHGYIGVG